MGGLHWNPLVRVKAITRREDAIYYALHMPWENTWLAAPTRYTAIRTALAEAEIEYQDDPSPSIYVPFPQAVDDHQTRNAEYLVDNDAALLLRQDARLAANLRPLLRDDDLVWVHDYHLVPLAGMLREAGARQPLDRVRRRAREAPGSS